MSTLFTGRFVTCSSTELPRDLDSIQTQEYDWILVSSDGIIQELGRGSNAPSADHRLDFGDRIVLPGLADAHIHVLATGKALSTIDFRQCRSIDDMRTAIVNWVETNEDGSQTGVLVGEGWAQDAMNGRYPCAADFCDLPVHIASRPLVFYRACHHICVCNSVALQLLGLDSVHSACPPGGQIDRDPSGQPTGILRETAADLTRRIVPNTSELRSKYIQRGLAACLESGVTSVQTNDWASWPEYVALNDGGKLALRVFLTIPAVEIGCNGSPPANTVHSPLLSCHRVKLFADGSLGASTAALSAPYVELHRCAGNHAHEEVPSNSGLLLYTKEQLTSEIARSRAAGFRLEIHVIGDLAAECALDALESAGSQPHERPILTHCQVLRADLIDRMQAMGVVADVQPQFVMTDSAWVDKRLPPQLLSYAYAWKTLMSRGIVCAGGSDSPIESPFPLVGIHSAMRRPAPQLPDNIFRPSECLSFAQALWMYTAGAAYCAGAERTMGLLAPGYVADFVVIGERVGADESACDWFDRKPDQLLTTKVEQVWVAGDCRLHAHD
jgi:predicted amidohydrolase YtcJ